MSAQPVVPQPAEAQKPVKIVDILPDQLSLLYANLHPVLLLSLVVFSFPTLVKDPINTLLGLAPTVLIVQAVYCVVCLPSSGQVPPPAHKTSQQKKKAAKPAQDIWAKIVPALLSIILTCTLSAPLLYIIIILFGAPLVSHHVQTLMLAVHLALVTTPQLYYVHGLDTAAWLRIVSLQQPVDETYGLSLGACVGAWLGAIPIPLDWDREWQKWPITIICGLYAGAAVGKLAGGYVFRGYKMRMT